MNGSERLKRLAAERAVELVEDGFLLGLGTGSTAWHVLEVLAERIRSGALRGIRGIATSRRTEKHALSLGIPLEGLSPETAPDLVLDGADEVDPRLNLIKGLGGALLWEKIVATAAKRLVIVVDSSKTVERLGTRGPLPVEVEPFGWGTQLPFLERLGARAELRRLDNGEPFVTDSGHYLLECLFDQGIPEPERLQCTLRQNPGILESGLFLGMTDTVVVAGDEGVELQRARLD